MKELEEILSKTPRWNDSPHKLSPEYQYSHDDVIEAMKKAYTLGRNNTADWIGNKKRYEVYVGEVIDANITEEAKTTEDLNLK